MIVVFEQEYLKVLYEKVKTIRSIVSNLILLVVTYDA